MDMARRCGWLLGLLSTVACESTTFEVLSTRDGGVVRDAGPRDAGPRDAGMFLVPGGDAGTIDGGVRERDGGVECSGDLEYFELNSPLPDNYVELTATATEFALAYNAHVNPLPDVSATSAVQRFPLRGDRVGGPDSPSLRTLDGALIHAIVPTPTAWPVPSDYVVLASASIVTQHYLEVGAVAPAATSTTPVVYTGGPGPINDPIGPRIGFAGVYEDRLLYPLTVSYGTLFVTTSIDATTSTVVQLGMDNTALGAIVVGPDRPWAAYVDRHPDRDDIVLHRLTPSGVPEGLLLRESVCAPVLSYDVAIYDGIVAMTADCVRETVVHFTRFDGRSMGTFTLGTAAVRTRVAVGYDQGIGEVAVLHWDLSARAPTVRFFELGDTSDGGGAVIASALPVRLPLNPGEATRLALVAAQEPPPRSRTRWAAAYAVRVGASSSVSLARFDGCRLP